LHAQKLELAHPRHGERMAWEASLPEDMHNLLSALRQRGTCSGVSCNA
jgi:23S rRNA pseudouridine1911/1915/1917 synthase